MKFMMVMLLAAIGWAADLSTIVGAAAVNISTSDTAITCPSVNKATFVQIYIRPTSTAQVYTVTLLNAAGTADSAKTIEIPSGGYFNFRVADSVTTTQTLFFVKTASSGAVLQVIAFKESK